jgi:hypothetical protein
LIDNLNLSVMINYSKFIPKNLTQQTQLLLNIEAYGSKSWPWSIFMIPIKLFQTIPFLPKEHISRSKNEEMARVLRFHNLVNK